jgi:N-acetylglucosaminyldiphosphoundecaprenol N-acetyl-beta-D-mannosaminyltransferase
MIDKKNILGVDITDATKKETLEYIVKNLENFKKKLYIVTPNPEFLVLANKNSVFKKILNGADLALTDGVGVVIAAKVLGKQLQNRFTGVDLVKNLCEAVSEKPITVGFLGGRDGVAEKTAECLRKKYPGLKISFVGEEWPSGSLGRLPHIADDVRQVNLSPAFDSVSLSERLPTTKHRSAFSSSASGQAPSFRSSENELPRFEGKAIDILFVAFGCPKQEFWISEHLDKIPVKVAVGVGGAFDYLSGKVPRAPSFMRSIGLEWLFRLIVQPWRIKRQLSLLKFVWLVVKEKVSGN